MHYPTSVLKTSVYLPEQLKARLGHLAQRSGRSEADLIRSAIEAAVDVVGEPTQSPPSPRPGHLVGIGVGPGAADLLTSRALDALRRASVVVAPTTDDTATGRAEAIVREAAPGVVVERLVFAMTPDQEQRWAALTTAAERVVELLDAGEEVAFITLGDPNLYSTFSSIAELVTERRAHTLIETVPGVMAFQELAARSGTVLADDQQSLMILPANEARMSAEESPVTTALHDAACTVILYKGGRQVARLAERLEEGARLDKAVMGELLGLPGERIAPLHEVASQPATYLSAVIVPATEQP